MSQFLAERMKAIAPSATLAISAYAAELKAKGKEIISLSVGEPDFETPPHVKEAAIAAIQNGFTHYTAVDGTPALKRAIVEKFKRENHLTYEPSQVLVSCGVKHSLFNAFAALLNEGDEVIIPAPYWVSYPEMVAFFGGLPVALPTTLESRFKITPDQLGKAISKKTKGLILNSPSNPTGMAYTARELSALGRVLQAHPNVVILSDDIYEHILWAGEPFVNILNVCPRLSERTLVMNGVSKAYAMTGWRIGYAAGPKEIIQAMHTVQSQSTSNPTSISQVAAQKALEGGIECVKPMVKAFKERHDFIVPALNCLPGFRCSPADGTFYAFPSVEDFLSQHKEIKDDIELAKQLLEHAGVAVVPGAAFGGPGHLRISFATGMETLKKAIEKLRMFLKT
ncbi:MAG: pyridoxal phosphate-dependent aminotransferase [Gammaproteobacteria bacterium]|nr:pyridoxal phosphate-dependent aminotransferase [Gammaproteobacteria bacterium]